MFNSVVPQFIQTYNVSRTISETTAAAIAGSSLSVVEQTVMISDNLLSTNTDISLIACFAFAVLILTTVGGNSLVLLALLLDKRLHSPSFYLIANMAIADLLLGLAVLPFSSVLELLNDRWIFGQSFCSAWLALDVLCCTASIIGLMAVSIDRYIGVTRPLNYSSIMTTRRTVYLLFVVWAVSILTSVVPLFGLTDREKVPNDLQSQLGRFETCKVNKNTFYTIFSSMISFYIPVIILLILYSRVYQEAKKQGQKLENEKRRLYQIDYQIASEHIRRKQTQTNGHSTEKPSADQRTPSQTPKQKRAYSTTSETNRNDATSSLINSNHNQDEDGSLDRTLHLNDAAQLKKDYADLKNTIADDDTVHSGSSMAQQITNARRSLGKRISSTFKRNSQGNVPNLTNMNSQQQKGQMSHNDELMIIKRKLHNLKREKKAFRTLGLILSALLICWLPFFVTLPLLSIRKRHGMINDDNTENTWFKITFWLGYCNSALNPFVYAFSNRAIRRAFRQVIFRRFCCCILRCWFCRYFCPNKLNDYNDRQSYQHQRTYSNSFTTQTSQVAPRRTSSFSTELIRPLPKLTNNHDSTPSSIPVNPLRAAGTGGPVVSFADFLAETEDDDIVSSSPTVKQSNQDQTFNSV